MTSQALESACAFAWRNYMLIRSGVSENDDRRAALYRYITNVWTSVWNHAMHKRRLWLKRGE
jgi:hypothetical protein